MKHCIRCDYFEQREIQFQDQSRPTLASICRHNECSDPVSGEPLLCGIARTKPEFCGIQGKYFQKKKVIEPSGNILTLSSG